MNPVNINDWTKIVNMNHYLFSENRMNRLYFDDGNLFLSEGLDISLSYHDANENMLLAKIEVKNLGERSVFVKLFVENYLDSSDYYGFISPAKDVLYFTKNGELYLLSGMLKNQSFSQYSVLKKRKAFPFFTSDVIPYCPLADGKVAGIYSLEQKIEPDEHAIGYTWVFRTDDLSETELHKKHQELKATLAF